MENHSPFLMARLAATTRRPSWPHGAKSEMNCLKKKKHVHHIPPHPQTKKGGTPILTCTQVGQTQHPQTFSNSTIRAGAPTSRTTGKRYDFLVLVLCSNRHNSLLGNCSCGALSSVNMMAWRYQISRAKRCEKTRIKLMRIVYTVYTFQENRRLSCQQSKIASRSMVATMSGCFKQSCSVAPSTTVGHTTDFTQASGTLLNWPDSIVAWSNEQIFCQ